MEEIIELMKERVKILKKSMKTAKQDILKFPEGRLRVSYSNHRARYYHLTETGPAKGTYIKKKDRILAQKLAMKEYNEAFLKDAEKELTLLEKTISILSKSNADLSFQNLLIHRKSLVTPYLQTDETYASKWLAKNLTQAPFLSEGLIYDTKRGEKVRSKSEAIIADILHDLGIPYIYEKKLVLKDGSTRRPDFTLLHVRKKEEIYLEHFGLLNQQEYLEKTLQKLDEYRASGIYPGKNLIFTYETEDIPLDIKGIRKMLHDILSY